MRDMKPTLLSPAEVLGQTRVALGLSSRDALDAVDDALLAQLLRAVAWVHLPCLAGVLVKEAERHLQGLSEDLPLLRERLAFVLETMCGTGDLVEPGQVTHADIYPRGALFPAPPSFAMLTRDVAQVFGVAGEDYWASITQLQGRVVHEGASRRIVARAGESLDTYLRDAGLRELSIEAWLKEPPIASAAEILDSARKHLRRAPPGDDIASGLEVFDSRAGRIYSSSWSEPRGLSGLVMARRPKAFGSTQWMLVELTSGNVEQVSFLPTPGRSGRACDEAWLLQLAADFRAGRPQQFRLRREGGLSVIDLLFPIPRWAHRRLLVLGRLVPRWRSICSYQVEEMLLEDACVFLERRLWMSRTE